MSLYLDINEKQKHVEDENYHSYNNGKKNNNQKQNNQKKTISTDVAKNGSLDAVKTSFTITYVLLLTTSLVTFIEAMRAQNPLIRHIFNLETCISLVGGYFYSVFITMIDDYKKNNLPYDWNAITKIRYIDWSITTPLMLLSLCLVLANESKKIVHLTTILLIFFLNYVMLYVGYLGEINVLNKNVACIGGFIPFTILFYIIFKNYTVINKGLSKYFLLLVYMITWSFYGMVYLLSHEYKNIAMNILDCFSKCIVGLLLWVYYTNIIPKV